MVYVFAIWWDGHIWAIRHVSVGGYVSDLSAGDG